MNEVVVKLKEEIISRLVAVESKSYDANFVLLNGRLDEISGKVDDGNQSIKDQLDAAIRAIRVNVVNRLMNDNQKLRTRVRTLEQRLAKVERQCNQIESNNRKNNVELDGIPESVSDNELKGKVAQILNSTVDDVTITESDIEACHRLQTKKRPRPTIVRARRDLLDKVKSNKKSLATTVTGVCGYPAGTNIFLNDNLSPNMRKLAYNARVLVAEGFAQSTWFSNACVRVKTNEGKVVVVTHECDLFKNFPVCQKLTYDVNFCNRIEAQDIEEYDDLDGWWDHEDFNFQELIRLTGNDPSAQTAGTINGDA